MPIHAGMSEQPAALILTIVPTTLREASAFVGRHHRHHPPPQGGAFAIAVARDGEIVGVAIVGRPVARMSDDGFTAEVTRVCVVDDVKNACSKLYAAAWRAARAMGYRRCVTYTLATEPGVSLRGAGWRLVGEAGGGSWSRAGRPRIDMHPLQTKLRWEAIDTRAPCQYSPPWIGAPTAGKTP